MDASVRIPSGCVSKELLISSVYLLVLLVLLFAHFVVVPDWLTALVLLSFPPTEQEAAAFKKIREDYCRSIAIMDGLLKQDVKHVHQHIHLHVQRKDERYHRLRKDLEAEGFEAE